MFLHVPIFFIQIYDDTRKPKNGIDWKWCSESAPNEGHQQEIHSSPFGQRFPRNAKRRRIGMLFRTFRSIMDHIGNHHLWNSAWCRLDVHRCIVVLLFFSTATIIIYHYFFSRLKELFFCDEIQLLFDTYSTFFLFSATLKGFLSVLLSTYPSPKLF